MSVVAFGYVGLRAKDLSDWAKFGSDFLGMQRVARHAARWRSAWTIASSASSSDADGGQGIGFFGWEVADAAAMEALCPKLEAAGVKSARGARALADERHVKDLIVFAGSGRNAHRGVSRARDRCDALRTRPQRLGIPHRPARHGPCGVALRGHRTDDGLLPRPARLPLSDYFMRPYSGALFHCNPRHHSLALTATGRTHRTPE